MTAPLPIPDVSHIPGPKSPPLVGHTLQVLRDSYGLHRACRAAYGDVYRVRLLGTWRVTLAGPDALEWVLTDREQAFSSTGGWESLARLFPRGLLTLDFEQHRADRRIMQAAFRAPAMRDYLARMAPEMERLVAAWPEDRTFAFYPAVKALTLKLGAAVFMGLDPDDPRAERLNRAFTDEVQAAVAPIRRAVPFTPMWRGVRGRAYLTGTFRAMIAERRQGTGGDFFSQMCRAVDEDGQAWSEQQIVDHCNLLVMAAHDTTASGLATMAWALGAHPDWQDAVAGEVAALGDAPLDEGALAAMPLTERVFREALRMVPPVPFIPRRAVRDLDWAGHRIPRGAMVTVSPGMVMSDPALWPEPERFDPDRFLPERAEDRVHRFAWAPFGGGVHKCIGMHFATMQVKAFTATLMRRRRVALAGPVRADWVRLPIPRPRDGLPVLLASVALRRSGSAAA